jgi:uncharacterized protein
VKRLNLLLKPVSSLCNLRCKYCFYADIGVRREKESYGVMNEETVKAIIENVSKDLEPGDEVAFAFQGGEPTLAGLSWFIGFADAVSAELARKSISCRYALQTNGIILDESWCAFLRERNFLVGLSLDGTKHFHDRNRFDPNGNGTWETVMAKKRLLETNHVNYNILCVLTNELAAYSEKVWRFIISEHIQYIQFIPCLENFDGKGAESLRPARFASFYNRLFPLWAEDVKKGGYVSVKLFDDMANFFYKGIVSACGMNGKCGIQFVVEADGSVFPCDFYAVDTWNAGNLATQTMSEIFATSIFRSFLDVPHSMSRLCTNCEYTSICGGGCKRMKNTVYYGNETLCGYKTVLDRCLKPLGNIMNRYLI